MRRVSIPFSLAFCLNLGGGGADHDHFPDLLVELHDFEQADPALVAGVVALVAALGLEDLIGLGFLGRKADLDQGLRRDLAEALQLLQSRRTSRWAWTRRTALATRKGSMPMLIKRAIVDGASLVCRVESTR